MGAVSLLRAAVVYIAGGLTWIPLRDFPLPKPGLSRSSISATLGCAEMSRSFIDLARGRSITCWSNSVASGSCESK
jgi:hypothetical protein